ncbi:MAG: hypothetical protein U0441_02100 [Polyangiaceae bacterium]
MGSAARKFEPIPSEERLAALMALPLRSEPPTEEEDAIFEEIEAELHSSGAGRHTPEEICATIEQMRRDQGE